MRPTAPRCHAAVVLLAAAFVPVTRSLSECNGTVDSVLCGVLYTVVACTQPVWAGIVKPACPVLCGVCAAPTASTHTPGTTGPQVHNFTFTSTTTSAQPTPTPTPTPTATDSSGDVQPNCGGTVVVAGSTYTSRQRSLLQTYTRLAHSDTRNRTALHGDRPIYRSADKMYVEPFIWPDQLPSHRLLPYHTIPPSLPLNKHHAACIRRRHLDLM